MTIIRCAGNSRTALLVIALLSGCDQAPPPLASAPAPRVEPAPAIAAASAPMPPAPPPGSYRACTDASYAPFSSRNERGEIAGFDVDVAQAIAAEAGITIEFVHTPWEGMFGSFDQGACDLLVSAIGITEGLRQAMDFSAPYFETFDLIVVGADSKVARFSDLRKRKVGVEDGSAGDDALSELQGKRSGNIVRFKSILPALQALAAGSVEAVVADNGRVGHYLVEHPDVRLKTVTDKVFEAQPLGIAVKKGNAELLARIDKGLAAIKADGVYEQIARIHFGAMTAPPAVPNAAAAPAASR